MKPPSLWGQDIGVHEACLKLPAHTACSGLGAMSRPSCSGPDVPVHPFPCLSKVFQSARRGRPHLTPAPRLGALFWLKPFTVDAPDPAPHPPGDPPQQCSLRSGGGAASGAVEVGLLTGLRGLDSADAPEKKLPPFASCPEHTFPVPVWASAQPASSPILGSPGAPQPAGSPLLLHSEGNTPSTKSPVLP